MGLAGLLFQTATAHASHSLGCKDSITQCFKHHKASVLLLLLLL
jgi:hypothetical protein